MTPSGARNGALLDAVPHGVVHAGDQVSSDDGQVGTDVIGISTARRTVFAGHVRAQMNVAIWTICMPSVPRRCSRDFDAAQIRSAGLGGKARHHAKNGAAPATTLAVRKKVRREGFGNDVFEIDAVRRNLEGSCGTGLMEAVPEPLETMTSLMAR